MPRDALLRSAPRSVASMKRGGMRGPRMPIRISRSLPSGGAPRRTVGSSGLRLLNPATPRAKHRRTRAYMLPVVVAASDDFSAMLLRRVVGRIDVVDRERSHAVDLDHRRFARPGIMLHALWRQEEATGRNGLTLGRIERRAHGEVHGARYHRDVLVRGMRVRHHLVLRGYADADDIGPVALPIAGNDSDLRAGRQGRRRSAPFIMSGLRTV